MIVIAVGHRGSAAQAGRGIMDHYNLMPSVVFHEGTVGSARAAGTATGGQFPAAHRLGARGVRRFHGDPGPAHRARRRRQLTRPGCPARRR